MTGPFFPVAILLYWMSNNIWTYGQQHIVFGHIAKEEEEAKLLKQEKLKANAPKPGARPDRKKKPAATNTNGADSTNVSLSKDGSSDKAGTDGVDADASPDESTTAAADTGAGAKPKPGQKPTRPGAGAAPGKKQNHNRGSRSTAKRGNKRGGKR